MFAILFSAKGTIKPRPFAIAITAVYVINLLVCNFLSLGFLARGGIIPFLLLQIVLTRIWFALHVKRLADSGRGAASAKTIAILFALFISFVALVAMGSQPSPQNSAPTESTLGGAISLIFAAFYLSGSGLGGLGYYFAALVAIPLFIILLVFAYSIAVGRRKSVVG